MAPTATPTPTPAFAPSEGPVSEGKSVLERLVADRELDAVVDAVTDADEDADAVADVVVLTPNWPRVSALVVPQHAMLSGPQHQVNYVCRRKVSFGQYFCQSHFWSFKYGTPD